MKILYMSIFCMILFASVISAQSSRKAGTTKPKPAQTEPLPAPDPVVVTLKTEHDSFKGKLISISTSEAKLQLESGDLTVALKDVISITFRDTSEADKQAESDNNARSAKQDVIKALVKMQSAVTVGVSNRDYGSRLIDSKAEIDILLPNLPDGEFKSKAKNALRHYEHAGLFWDQCLKMRTHFLNVSDPIASIIITLYKIPTSEFKAILGNSTLYQESTIRIIWSKADEDIASAKALIVPANK